VSYDAAIAEGERALELGKRFGDRDLQAIALVTLGRVNLLNGKPTEGVRLLDEASAAALSGELRPYSTGLVYCVTITSCNGVGDLRRAAEWTKAAEKWCTKQDVKGFPGSCRIHHSSLLRLNGDWAAAEEQALQACDEVRDFDPWATAIGWYEVGEIRRQRGDFAAAEEAYREAKKWSRDPQPGLALLRLAQGKTEAAAKAIERSLAATKDSPSRIRRLAAQVEVALAGGQIGLARTAAEELEERVDELRIENERTPAFEALVCVAWGRIRLEENDAGAAATLLEKALETWQSVGAPYEAAQVRVLLGRALRKLDEEDGAQDEFHAARAVFEKVGAVLDAQVTAELLGEIPLARTFVFTDIVDSTKLQEVLGDAKWQKLLAWHDRTLRDLIEQQGGEVIKQTGDGFFAAFDSPGPAVEAAVAIQRALDSHDGVVPDVRIGVHAGEAFAKGDSDLGGQGVHAAARVGALADAGEILATAETVRQAGIRYGVSEARPAELKGFTDPVDVVTVSWR